MLVIDPVLYKKTVLPYMSSFLLTNLILYQKALLPNMSFFVLIACSFLVPFSIWKNLLFELYNLFSAKYVPFTDPIPRQKRLYMPNSLSENPNMSSFLLTKCPSLTAFPARKALLPHVTSFLLIACLYWPNFLSKRLCYPI